MAGAATDMSDAEVAGIDEANEFGRFVVQQRVGADWVARCGPSGGQTWLDVRCFLGHSVGIAAVAIATAELDGWQVVHVLDALVTIYAAPAFAHGVGVGLAKQVFGGQGSWGEREWFNGLWDWHGNGGSWSIRGRNDWLI